MSEYAGIEKVLTRQVQLDLIELGSVFMADQARVTIRPDDNLFGKYLKVAIRSLVPQQKLAKDSYTESYEVPASWWEHWKQDHAPEWLKARWPVQYLRKKLTIRVERSLLYPEAKFALPHDKVGYPVIFETVSRPGGGW